MSKAAKQVTSQLYTWHFQFQEGSLSSSAHIDQLTEDCKLFRAPSIIFGENYCLFRQKQSNFKILFNAAEALKLINYEKRKLLYRSIDDQPEVNSISYLPERFKVKHASKWEALEKPKDIQICQIEEVSDSFFVTPFKGHVEGQIKLERVKEGVIPAHKLGPENPIKFYNQGSIYEDQLDDNGLVQYDFKFRAMEKCWFGLIRCYTRVDDVVCMILDTRLYWEEGWKKVARQFMVKKATWPEMKSKGFDFQPGWTMNPNQSHLVYPYLETMLEDNEYMHYA